MKKNGFTLVELLAVITILGLLVIIAKPNLYNTLDRNVIKLYEENEKRLETAALTYLNENYFSSDINKIVITQDQLVSNGYIDRIVDVNNNNKYCDGYIIIDNIQSSPIINAYISCEKYITIDYDETILNN